MALDTTAFTIQDDYIIGSLPVINKNISLLSFLGAEIQDYDKSWDGKAAAGLITYPTDPKITTTAIGESGSGASTDNEYSESSVSVTIEEKGDIMEKVTSWAMFQTYNRAYQSVFNWVVASAFASMNEEFAEKMVEGGTGADQSVGGDPTQWKVVDPNVSHEPASAIDTRSIINAVTMLEESTVPFDDGLFRVLYHHHVAYDFRNEARTTGINFQDYSKARQSASVEPIEYAYNEIDVYEGCAFKKVYSDSFKITDGGATGDAYKTLVFGKYYVGAKYVPTENLKDSWNKNGVRVPISRYIELRITPDSTDAWARGVKISPYWAGNPKILRKEAGVFFVHTSNRTAPIT